MPEQSIESSASGPELQTLADLPTDVLAAILGAPRKSKVSFSGRTLLNQQVLLADELTISALSETFLRIKQLPPEYPFYVIAAGVISIERAATDKGVALLDFLYEGPALQGNPGQPGRKGRSWGVDWTAEDGEPGGHGETGGPGVNGSTIDKPPLYFVYKELHVFGGNPVVVRPLTINLYGYNGGDGGKGGKGGAGGDGAKGTPSSVGGLPVWPWVECKSGPGIGGNAGTRGQGGRGGDAGRGGNGGNIYYVGPRGPQAAYERITQQFEVFTSGGDPGSPGAGGEVGEVGQPGEAGRRRDPCNARRPGDHSAYPSPLSGGHGTHGQAGETGNEYRIWRDNDDIFP